MTQLTVLLVCAALVCGTGAGFSTYSLEKLVEHNKQNKATTTPAPILSPDGTLRERQEQAIMYLLSQLNGTVHALRLL